MSLSQGHCGPAEELEHSTLSFTLSFGACMTAHRTRHGRYAFHGTDPKHGFVHEALRWGASVYPQRRSLVFSSGSAEHLAKLGDLHWPLLQHGAVRAAQGALPSPSEPVVQ